MLPGDVKPLPSTFAFHRTQSKSRHPNSHAFRTHQVRNISVSDFSHRTSSLACTYSTVHSFSIMPRHAPRQPARWSNVVNWACMAYGPKSCNKRRLPTTEYASSRRDGQHDCAKCNPASEGLILINPITDSPCTKELYSSRLHEPVSYLLLLRSSMSHPVVHLRMHDIQSGPATLFLICLGAMQYPASNTGRAKRSASYMPCLYPGNRAPLTTHARTWQTNHVVLA